MSELPDDRALELAIQKYSDDEPTAAYQAFLAYVGLHGKDRNAERVKKLTGASQSDIVRWRSAYRWQARADQVDAQRWLAEERARQEFQAKDNQTFLAENRKIKEKAFKISNQMLDVTMNLLKSADLAGKVVETGKIETRDGRMVPTTTQIHMKSKVSDIPRMVEVAVKVARLSAELPTEIVDSQLPIGADLTKLSVEELEALQADNRQKLMAKGGIIAATDANN